MAQKVKTTVGQLVDHMLQEGGCMSAYYEGVLENVKGRMCDEYCKYPAQYSVKDDDANYDRLVNEVCESCPMNVL